MNRPVPRCRAFTLIELVLAASLASLLMLGILVVLNGVVRDARRVSSHEAARRDRLPLDVIERDLAHSLSSAAVQDGGRIVFKGNMGLDPRTRMPNGRLSRVAYRIESKGGASWLVREQAYLDDPLRPTPWSELIAVGATGFSIRADLIRIEFADAAVERPRSLR